MRKKTMSVMLTVLIAAIFIGLFAFLAWGTDWFSSTARLRKLFGDESVTAAAHVSEESMTVGARNAGVIHDSEDATAAVNVYYVDTPFIITSTKGIYIYNQYGHIPGRDVTVYVGLSTSNYKTFSFVNAKSFFWDNEDTGSRCNEHYISYTEVKNAVTELGGSGSEDILVWAKVDEMTAYGKTYLERATSPVTFKLVETPLDISLAGTTLTLAFPDTADVENPAFILNVNFYDIDDTYIAVAYLNNGMTRSGHTYTVDLTHFDFVNTPTDCIKVDLQFTIASALPKYLFNCEDFQFCIIKLATPTNIKYESGVLSWNAVENAQGYKIFIGDDDATGTVLTETQYDFHGKPVGNYNVRIRALGNVGAALASSARMTAFNASLNVQQVVALSYVVGDDTVTKFVPHGSKFSDVAYEVVNPEYEFGGWFYDSGYSVRVLSTDEITADTTIYARLSDVEVTERPLTWWEKHKWQVLIPCFVVGGLMIAASVVVAIKKRKGGK